MKKKYKFKCRNSGVNPFLVNPIKAMVGPLAFNIDHALMTGQGLIVFGQYANETNAYTGLNMIDDEVELLNRHELMRFTHLLKMLKIKL